MYDRKPTSLASFSGNLHKTDAMDTTRFSLYIILLFFYTDCIVGGQIVYKNVVYLINSETTAPSTRKPKGRRLIRPKYNCENGQIFSLDLEMCVTMYSWYLKKLINFSELYPIYVEIILFLYKNKCFKRFKYGNSIYASLYMNIFNVHENKIGKHPFILFSTKVRDQLVFQDLPYENHKYVVFFADANRNKISIKTSLCILHAKWNILNI